MHETVDTGRTAKIVHVWVSDFVLEQMQGLDENGISMSGTDLMLTGFILNEFVDS